MLTQEHLKEWLYYNPHLGIFVWRKNKGTRAKAGAIAGCQQGHGYIDIIFDKVRYSAHRLAFFYMTGAFPERHTDHINGIRHDNRWCNLRAVTAFENHRNHRMSKNNTSGVTGVGKIGDRWRAQIKHDYQIIHLGSFDTKEEAIECRLAANIEYGFHENHGN